VSPSHMRKACSAKTVGSATWSDPAHHQRTLEAMPGREAEAASPASSMDKGDGKTRQGVSRLREGGSRTVTERSDALK